MVVERRRGGCPQRHRESLVRTQVVKLKVVPRTRIFGSLCNLNEHATHLHGDQNWSDISAYRLEGAYLFSPCYSVRA